MASKIVPGDIDATYPKAGQDNTSQGFRDNFAGIKNKNVRIIKIFFKMYLFIK